MKRLLVGLCVLALVATAAYAANKQYVDQFGINRTAVDNGDGTYGLQTSASGSSTITGTGTAGTPATGVVTIQGITGGTAQNVTSSSQLPLAAVALNASATATTGAATVSLAADAARTNYLCSFQIDADATAATDGTATISGLIGGTMTIRQSVAATASGTASRWHDFNPCIPASGVNVAITMVTLAAGTGGNTAANLAGFKQ